MDPLETNAKRQRIAKAIEEAITEWTGAESAVHREEEDSDDLLQNLQQLEEKDVQGQNEDGNEAYESPLQNNSEDFTEADDDGLYNGKDETKSCADTTPNESDEGPEPQVGGFAFDRRFEQLVMGAKGRKQQSDLIYFLKRLRPRLARLMADKVEQESCKFLLIVNVE